MRCHLTGDVEAYTALTGPLLEAEPVANNVALTVIEGARAGRYDDAVFAWVEDSDNVVVGAASHTPPFRLLLPVMAMAAVDAVCDGLLERAHCLPGVTDRYSRQPGSPTGGRGPPAFGFGSRPPSGSTGWTGCHRRPACGVRSARPVPRI